MSSVELKYFAVSLLLICTYACQSKSRVVNKPKKQVMPAAMIHYQMMFSDLEKEISFPLWFNDSVIQANKIQSITRSIYPRMPADSMPDTTKLVPSEQWNYVFNQTGGLQKVYHRTFYDDRMISLFLFRFSKNNPQAIYQAVKVDSIVQFEQNINNPNGQNRLDDLYRIYTPLQITKTYSSYENKGTKNRFFLVHDSQLTNPLSINKTLRPEPKDRILFGQLPYPIKIYSVENQIKESRVRDFTYSNGQIKKIEVFDFPFVTHRNFSYNGMGYCKGFVDSLYANDGYLNKTIVKFYLNYLNAPNTIVHVKTNPDSNAGFSYLENFQYALFP